MNKRMEEIIQLAKQLGLDFFPIIFETVDFSTMTDICSYGLPTRARHWSYGRAYDHQKLYGEMGYSKIYEVILNNNPSYAFLLDKNTETQNLFITAHCCAHSAFFKKNQMFQKTDRNMISHAAEHAGRIESYIERFGFERVERIMDIGFALDDHIDWHKGLYRKKYQHVKSKKIVVQNEFDDLLGRPKLKPIKTMVQKKVPPHPEKDLLWFLTNYAPLEEWERDILDIIREESYYFYPQKMTKIINEGFATYWHAEIMYHYSGLSSSEYLDFVRDHEKVVQPGGNPFRINPYYLGFKIFKNIEKQWDIKYGKGSGKKKIFEVMEEDDDVSFLRNYLTVELAEELNLFTFGYQEEYDEDYDGVKYIEIKSKMLNDIIETIVRPLYNGGSPKIVVTEIGKEGGLVLKHQSEEVGTLEQKYAAKTLEYIWDLWAAPIELHTLDDDENEIVVYFDEGGANIKKTDEDYNDDDEDDDLPIKKASILIP